MKAYAIRVIPAVGILAAVIWPVFATVRTDQLSDVQIDQSSLRRISHVIRLYSSDYDDLLPTAVDSRHMAGALDRFLPIVRFTASRHPTDPAFEFNVLLSGRRVASVQDRPFVYDRSPREEGKRFVGFLEGPVKSLSTQEFDALWSRPH